MTGVYSAESLADCSWLCMSLGLIFFYHFVILQGLGLVLSTILFYLGPIAPTLVKYNTQLPVLNNNRRAELPINA